MPKSGITISGKGRASGKWLFSQVIQCLSAQTPCMVTTWGHAEAPTHLSNKIHSRGFCEVLKIGVCFLSPNEGGMVAQKFIFQKFSDSKQVSEMIPGRQTVTKSVHGPKVND